MPTDVRGKEFTVGQEVARGYSINSSGSVAVRICVVTDVRDGKVYLDNSTQPVKFPERMAILSS